MAMPDPQVWSLATSPAQQERPDTDRHAAAGGQRRHIRHLLALEVAVSYRRYAKVLKWLTVSLLAYPITALFVHEPWTTILRATFVPHIQFSASFFYIITAVIVTTITPYIFFWQTSQEVEENAARTANQS